MTLTRKTITMMSKSTPWDGIPTPTVDFTVVRVTAPTGVPIYWGRDAQGHCLLIIGLEGDFTAEFRSGIVPLHGIKIDLRNGINLGQQRLVLTLAHHVDHDLFLSLCKTLIDSISGVSDSGGALAVTFTHLRRWKAFLSGRNAKLLSPEEIRGLFGELHILRMLYQQTLSQAAAISAWCGPDYRQQDFIFGDRAIEVKSLSGRERSIVSISSEDQLECVTDNLFLVIQRVIEMSDANQALSLNGIISLVEGELTDGEAVDLFSDKLANVGYAPLAEYDAQKFTVTGMRGYHITNEFPRLIRSQLPPGITRVSYSINLEVIEPFSCLSETIFQRT